MDFLTLVNVFYNSKQDKNKKSIFEEFWKEEFTFYCFSFHHYKLKLYKSYMIKIRTSESD